MYNISGVLHRYFFVRSVRFVRSFVRRRLQPTMLLIMLQPTTYHI